MVKMQCSMKVSLKKEKEIGRREYSTWFLHTTFCVTKQFFFQISKPQFLNVPLWTHTSLTEWQLQLEMNGKWFWMLAIILILGVSSLADARRGSKYNYNSLCSSLKKQLTNLNSLVSKTKRAMCWVMTELTLMS